MRPAGKHCNSAGFPIPHLGVCCRTFISQESDPAIFKTGAGLALVWAKSRVKLSKKTEVLMLGGLGDYPKAASVF
jgi:hypothetical protein